MEKNEFVIKEFHIIVKNPTNGDPLNYDWPEKIMQDQVSVGWKFLLGNGNWYGDYIHAGKTANLETLVQAIQTLLDQAMQTMKALKGEDESGKD